LLRVVEVIAAMRGKVVIVKQGVGAVHSEKLANF